MAGATSPLPEMPVSVREAGPQAGLKWLLEHGLETEDLEAELQALRAGTGEKVKAVVAGGAGAETNRPIDIFEGLPRHRLKIISTGGGDGGNIVLIEHQNGYFLDSIDVHFNPIDSNDVKESMVALGQLADLPYVTKKWNENLRVDIKDTISYKNVRLPSPFLPSGFEASQSTGFWLNSALDGYLELCRSRGSVSGIETRRDENNVDWQIGNGFEKK